MKKSQRTKSLALCTTLLASSWAAQAYTVDLSAAGASGSIQGGLYTQVAAQSAGSGLINSFVRVGAANQDVVQAYNTTASTGLDNVGGASFNHEITVGQVGLLANGGNPVMRFLLDINQTNAAPLLNLDEVQIFLSTTPNQSTASLNAGLLALSDAALVYQMDAGGDNKVTLNYVLNPGSGAGDMTLDILGSALDPAFTALGLTTDAQKNGAYLYLYSRFGSAPNVNNDGYEEWAYVQGDPIDPPALPEPPSLALVALGLLAASLCLRQSKI